MAVGDGAASNDAPWVYLGKDVHTRRRLEAGHGPRRRVGQEVADAVRELRQPFLDFVADIGVAERGRLAWWGTTLSWKVWSASDLFLLTVYLRVAERLVTDAIDRGTPLRVVVEDPWLLRQLAAHLRGRPVSIDAMPLWRLKVTAGTMGLLRRLSWLLVTLGARRRQHRASASNPAATSGDVAIYSMPLDRCLMANGAWRDPFLADLDAFLRADGFAVRRFSPPESVGFESEIAERHAYFHPWLLRARAGAIVRSLVAWWSPRGPWPTVGGLDVRFLAAREWWTDVARANWCRYRLFLECARAFFASASWSWAVYPFENHPWEKMLVAAAREHGVRTVAVQHSTLSVNYLAYFLGRGEAEVMPVADAILASGEYARRVMDGGGYPAGRVVLAGSLRYQHLASVATIGPASDVLVALPIDRPMAEHLIAALGEAFPDGGRANGVRFHVRAHPSTPVDLHALGLEAGRSTGDLGEAFRQCGSAIFVGTTLGPEAAACGLRALRFRPELLVDVDVAEAVGDALPSCSEGNLRAAVLDLVAAPPPAIDRAALLTMLFAPVDVGALKSVFGRTS